MNNRWLEQAIFNPHYEDLAWRWETREKSQPKQNINQPFYFLCPLWAPYLHLNRKYKKLLILS